LAALRIQWCNGKQCAPAFLDRQEPSTNLEEEYVEYRKQALDKVMIDSIPLELQEAFIRHVKRWVRDTAKWEKAPAWRRDRVDKVNYKALDDVNVCWDTYRFINAPK
jgi:hypothetical protein